MPNQFRATSNRPIVPYSQAADVRQGAGRLREQYAMRDARERQEAEMDLGERQFTQQQGQFESRLGFEKEAHQEQMQFSRDKFLSEQRQAEEVAGMARGGTMLQAGIGGAKLMGSRGMFDKPGSFGGGRTTQSWDPVAKEHFQEPSRGMWDMPEVGQMLQSGAGGFTGGMMGAGGAKALGAKKKWQTAAAGAAFGMAGSWLAGGDSIWDLGIGGLMGGGIGALI